eukprot:2456493-Rhodomonas_salina.1
MAYCYARSGTRLVLTKLCCYALATDLPDVAEDFLHRAKLLHTHYCCAMSGTEMGMLLWSSCTWRSRPWPLSGPEMGMLLRTRYGLSGTDKAMLLRIRYGPARHSGGVPAWGNVQY